jgi:4-amino-4-deoxy-L-arabinose transferase-like glycosyltransferase
MAHSVSQSKDLRRSDLISLATLTIVVGVIFGIRLTDRPLVGEETRYGTAAREMIASGDWLVFRQQEQVFAERPPMTIWTVAAAGLLRGEVDIVAVRLASVISIVLTSLLLYLYVRSFASGFAAFSAGLIYPTMGQVLQIGRLGESEPLFTLMLSSSLLLWHLGYLKKWPAIATWSVGFGFAALAALVKGPQAPIYFVSIIGVYLIVRRDWRYLFSWPTIIGAALFVSILAAWQVPYYLVTDWESVVATWTGLVQDRVRPEGLIWHIADYPRQIFVALLPWSPFLFALIFRQVRERLAELSPVVTFLLVAILVTFPSVLLAVGAKERYYMPLYPCFAALIALVVDRCASAEPGSRPRRSWHEYTFSLGVVTGVAGIAFILIGMLPNSWAESSHQPRWFAILFAVLSLATGWICFRSLKSGTTGWNIATMLSIGMLFGVINLGILINLNAARWNDPTASVAGLKSLAPKPGNLVSLGPIDHRFAYYFETPIKQLDWPTDDTPLPNEVEYFVFMRYPGDTPEKRSAGRGRSWYTTPRTVPFEWEELASHDCNRRIDEGARMTVVLGRVQRPIRVAASDVTRPRAKRPATASQSPNDSSAH